MKLFLNLIKLCRPYHYLKNGFIFLPLLFSGYYIYLDSFIKTVTAFVVFSLLASVVYIINDLKDLKSDKLHPKKKYRPLASGSVAPVHAILLASTILIILVSAMLTLNFSAGSIALLFLYLLINIAYSFGLKNIPILDISILSIGFVIRVIYGAEIINVDVSRWLFLTIFAFSFFMSFGKRRNEISENGQSTRKVNKAYSLEFLDKNMYVCLAMTLVFYSLWAIEPSTLGSQFYLSIPLFTLILMTYSLNIERSGSRGDPVDVLLSDKTLMALSILYIGSMLMLSYV